MRYATHVLAMLVVAVAATSRPATAFDATPSPAAYARCRAVLDSLAPKDGPATLVVVREGNRTTMLEARGMNDLARRTPASASSMINVGSVSKQFTAVMIYQLVEQGKINLADPLRKYVPELPPYADSITIDHLLHHRSGVRDYLALGWLQDFDIERSTKPTFTDSVVYDILRRQSGLSFAPGTKFSYSNSGYWFLEQIVTRVTRQPLRTLFRDRIARPLAMSMTGYDPDTTSPAFVHGYALDSTGAWQERPCASPVYGGGGVHTTLNDAARWLEELRSHTALGEALWKRMLTKGLKADGTPGIYAGGLFYEDVAGHPTIGHGGDDQAYHCWVGYVTDMDLGIAVFTASDELSPMVIVDALLQETPMAAPTPAPTAGNPPATVMPTATDRERCAGRYRIQNGLTLAVEANDSTLTVLQEWNGASYALAATSAYEYHLPSEPSLVFQFRQDSATGAVASVAVVQGDTTIATRVTGDQVDSLAARLPGTYGCADLQTTYRLSLNDRGGVVCVVAGDTLGMLSRGADGKYVLASLTFTFRTGDDGRVTGFVMDHPRARGLVFIRKDS